jgi:hypothetical protein
MIKAMTKRSDTLPPEKSPYMPGHPIFSMVVHTFAALIGVPLIWLRVIGMLDALLTGWLRSDVFALCSIFAIGLVLGYLANRVVRERVAYWVWVPGLIWLALGIRDSVRYHDPYGARGCSVSQDVINSLFVGDSSRCSESLAWLLFTVPALASIAYSFGAWIALRARRNQSVVPSVLSR